MTASATATCDSRYALEIKWISYFVLVPNQRRDLLIAEGAELDDDTTAVRRRQFAKAVKCVIADSCYNLDASARPTFVQEP